MKIIGIDAHLLLRTKKDGVPRYAQKLIEGMMCQPLFEGERIILYGHQAQPKDLVLANGWSWKVLHWPIPRGWTHGRLSLEMFFHAPDVLFVPGHEVPTFVSKKTKVVTTLHDIVFKTVRESYEPSSRQRQDLAVRRALSRAQKILTPSEATKKDLIDEYHVASDRITVTPLAPTIPVIDEPADDLLRRAQIIDGQYVLYIGRIEKKKNVEQLVRAFALLKRSLGSTHPLKLVLAGTDGFGAENVRRAIEEEKMADDVRMVGYVSDHDASLLLQHALCFTFPSKGEGFGIPILEAMEHGTPVIASYITALAEVAGGAAVLVSPNDIAALASAIRLLMTDEKLRDEYRIKGKARAAEFSWERCATTTFDALRAAI